MIADKTSPVRIPANRRGMDRYIYTMVLKNSLHGNHGIPCIGNDDGVHDCLPLVDFREIPVSKVQNTAGGLEDPLGTLIVSKVSPMTLGGCIEDNGCTIEY